MISALPCPHHVSACDVIFRAHSGFRSTTSLSAQTKNRTQFRKLYYALHVGKVTKESEQAKGVTTCKDVVEPFKARQRCERLRTESRA